MDHLIQQALLQVLMQIFEPTSSDASHSFRPGRRGHDVVWRAREYVEEGYDWGVDLDLKKFLDRVNHDALMARVARKETDKPVLLLAAVLKWVFVSFRATDDAALSEEDARWS